MSERGGLVEIDTDGQITAIIQKLQRLPDQLTAPDILKNALNDTTREVRRIVNKRARKRYALTETSVLKEKAKGAAWIDPATSGDPTAILLSRGPMLDLMNFMTQPNSGTAAAAAKVINESSAKSLEMGGLKAFVATFASGHTAIVQRHPPGKYSRGESKRMADHAAKGRNWMPDMTKIKKLLGPAVPHMMGAALSMSQEETSAVVYDVLQKHIDRQISKTTAAQ